MKTQIENNLDYDLEQLKAASFYNIDSWKPIDQFTEEHSQFKPNQLRWLLRNRKSNGFHIAVKKIGKLIYINEQLFAEWLMLDGSNEQSGGAK